VLCLPNGVTVGRGVLEAGLLLDVGLGGLDAAISIVQLPQAARSKGKSRSSMNGNNVPCVSLVFVVIAFSMTDVYGYPIRICVTISTRSCNNLVSRYYESAI
jgi:hypothetical protein